MSPHLSVVIPTYNRATRLINTLEAVVNQSLDKDDFEIIIVDDGSQDGTEQTVADYGKTVDHHIRYYWQENQFAGAARNLGIRNAKADIVLLMDSDMIPHPDHVAHHLALHRKYPEPEVAVLGRIVTRAEDVDLLRDHVADIPPIARAAAGEPVIDAINFVTADVSLKRAFVIQAGWFTPGQRVAEDFDLAWRLQALGLRLLYCREAVATHTEPLDTIAKVINSGRVYGRTFADWYGQLPIYQQEIWNLGGRFDGGWAHLRRHPWGYLKDALRRWMINRYSIGPMVRLATRLPVTNPPTRSLRRLCKEIWAYNYRDAFYQRRRQLQQAYRRQQTPPSGLREAGRLS